MILINVKLVLWSLISVIMTMMILMTMHYGRGGYN